MQHLSDPWMTSGSQSARGPRQCWSSFGNNVLAGGKGVLPSTWPQGLACSAVSQASYFGDGPTKTYLALPARDHPSCQCNRPAGLLHKPPCSNCTGALLGSGETPNLESCHAAAPRQLHHPPQCQLPLQPPPLCRSPPDDPCLRPAAPRAACRASRIHIHRRGTKLCCRTCSGGTACVSGCCNTPSGAASGFSGSSWHPPGWQGG